MSRKSILLTGATGFLGSHLLKFWINKGHRLVVLKRSTSSTQRLEGYLDQFNSYDVDQPNWEKVFLNHDIDVVVHVATDYGRGELFSEIVEANVLFTLKLIELSKNHGVSVFINTDTFFNKGNLDYEYLGGYTLTKKMVEQALPLYADNTFKICNAKLEHIYGPHDNINKFATQILLKLMNNDREILLTEGSQKRDFVYVDDVVTAYDTIIINYQNLNSFEQVLVGTGIAQSVRFFVEKLKEISKSNSELVFGALPIRKGEFSESYADISFLKKLGWKPNFHLTDGLINFVKITKNTKG